MNGCHIKIIYFFSFMLFLLGQFAYAKNVLKDYDIYESKYGFRLTLFFNREIEYMGHRPLNEGKFIQVKMLDQKNLRKPEKNRESLVFNDAKNHGIEKAVYEASVPGGPFLVIMFDRVVQFEIEPIKRYDKISINISKKNIFQKNKKRRKKGLTSKSIIFSSEENTKDLYSEGEHALKDGRNTDAILIFTQFLNLNESTYERKAKELLALSRERNGQPDLALKEYESYLTLYPKSDRKKVVQQRLMSIKIKQKILEKIKVE